jgi:hypothetical protein
MLPLFEQARRKAGFVLGTTILTEHPVRAARDWLCQNVICPPQGGLLHFQAWVK